MTLLICNTLVTSLSKAHTCPQKRAHVKTQWQQPHMMKSGRRVPFLAHLSSQGIHQPWPTHPRAVTLSRAVSEPHGSLGPWLCPEPPAFVCHCLCQAGDFKLPFLKDMYYIFKKFLTELHKKEGNILTLKYRIWSRHNFPSLEFEDLLLDSVI